MLRTDNAPRGRKRKKVEKFFVLFHLFYTFVLSKMI